MSAEIARLKRSLDRGPVLWLARYALIFGLGRLLVWVIERAVAGGQPDWLSQASQLGVRWALFGLWSGAMSWEGRTRRYQTWLAATTSASSMSPSTGPVQRATPVAVTRPALQRVGFGLLIAAPIVWATVSFCTSGWHDQIQDELRAGRIPEACSDARRLQIAAWLWPLPVDALSDAHVALGLGGLEDGDVGEAGEHLLAAARTSKSPNLNPVGMSQLLVHGLLERGESEVVVKYLRACRVEGQWGSRDLDVWIDQVRRGERPNFGPMLAH